MHTAAVVADLPPKRERPKKITESVYGPERLFARLGQIAASDGRSKSDLIVGILEQWVHDYEKKHLRK